MKYSLRTKLSISFSLLALILVTSISLISNMFLQKQFSEYIMKQQEKKNIEVVQLIGSQYDATTGLFKVAGVENIGINSLEQGLILKVTDQNAGLVWDAVVHNNGLCKQMIDSMSKEMADRYPGFKGGLAERNYPVMNAGIKIGGLKISYYGPYYLTESDSSFLDALNRILFKVGIVSLFLAILFGVYLAKKISTPISSAITAAEQLSKRDYHSKILTNSKTIEISKLINTINDLGTTLQNQDMLRKRLTSDVAHELRTPLTTLQSHLDAMIEGIWEISTDRLISIKEEILRITKIVGDLENLARYENENLRLEKTQVDIKKLIEKCLNGFEAELAKKNIKTSIDGNSSIIIVDIDKISQVFVNLISNAIKYSLAGGKIDIAIISYEKWLLVDIKDSGIGISSEDLPHIFERFYRADQSRNRGTGGSGIGLSIVKAIMDAHEGKIEVESEPGKGTCFTIYLPADALSALNLYEKDMNFKYLS